MGRCDATGATDRYGAPGQAVMRRMKRTGAMGRATNNDSNGCPAALIRMVKTDDRSKTIGTKMTLLRNLLAGRNRVCLTAMADPAGQLITKRRRLSSQRGGGTEEVGLSDRRLSVPPLTQIRQSSVANSLASSFSLYCTSVISIVMNGSPSCLTIIFLAVMIPSTFA